MVLLGGAGLAGAALPLVMMQLGSIPLHFVWSLLFPMLSALAFGMAGGLVSGLAGPVLIPLLLWPGQGMAAAVYGLCCIFWFGWIGFCVDSRARAPRSWNHPAVAPLPPLAVTLAIYLLAFPGMMELARPGSVILDRAAVVGIALKAATNFTFALLGARCLLKLAAARRLLGLPTPPCYRFNGWVLAATSLIILLLAAMIVALDRLLIDPHNLSGAPPGETVFLVVMSVTLLAGGLICCRFIEEQTAAADQLRQAQAVFNTTLEGLVVTDPDGTILAANPAFAAITGHGADAVRGKTLSILDSAPGSSTGFAVLSATLSGSEHWQGTVWIRRADGQVIPQWLTISAVRDDHGKPVNYVGVYTDITAIRNNAAQLEHLAHHDPLTGLPNRLLLKSRLSHALESVRRRNGVGAVLFIDLDRFKQVNDTLGHRYGDELLQQLVHRLRNRLRESDTLGRLGGDEFVAVLEDITSPDDAALVAASLIEQAGLPFDLSDDHRAQVGCSIGISLFPDDAAGIDELMHNADLALYQAKEQGRGRYCFYNGEHAAQSLKRQTSNVALAEALSSGGLELYFQPVVSLVDGSVQGTEALLRWRDHSGRVLTPDQFMPMAENTALMTRLGDWVLREACRIMKGWVDEGLPVATITVNLSSHQFKMPDLPQRIGEALQESGLEPHRLELDITEAAVMPRGDDPLSRLKDLKSLGLRLALDDFGTGYSSFAKLGEYPVDKIKVDRKFVHEINGEGGTAAAIVAMARLLQIPVQAEGIETEWQREMLVRSQCDAGQGYLFSRPMPEDEFRSWMDSKRIH